MGPYVGGRRVRDIRNHRVHLHARVACDGDRPPRCDDARACRRSAQRLTRG
ncbi:hypothetical protein [Ornithinimicrobium kibberense]|uniref:hypothetical protein n=1 Tax=Ornithinimicrobium kibberense TaxID=282060 RepID=UPI00360C8828